MRTYRLAQPVVTFIVRLWVEPSVAGEAVWRGEVVRVQTGQRYSFQDLSAAFEFILAHLRSTQPDSATKDPGAPSRSD